MSKKMRVRESMDTPMSDRFQSITRDDDDDGRTRRTYHRTPAGLTNRRACFALLQFFAASAEQTLDDWPRPWMSSRMAATIGGDGPGGAPRVNGRRRLEQSEAISARMRACRRRAGRR